MANGQCIAGMMLVGGDWHLTDGWLNIVIEIVSRVYIEEEIAIEGSQNQPELSSSSAYYKRQVSSKAFLC